MAERERKGSAVMQSVSLLMIGTILSKVTGFLREILVAHRFGSGVISDSFVLTNGISDILFCAVGMAISINFIPCYTRLDGKNRKDRFTSNVMNLTALILLIGSALAFLFPGVVLTVFAGGLQGEAAQVSSLMLRIVVFASIPIMLSHLFQAYCQVNGEFLTTALYGVFINLITIVFIFLAGVSNYWLLSVGTLTGNFLGMLLPLWGMKRKGFRYSPVCTVRDDAVKRMLFLTGPLLAENLASNLSLLVDRNLASFLDTGTITSLSYAGNITNIASTMIATAILTATFPLFSKMLSAGENEAFEGQFEKYAAVICCLLAPISVFMILNAKDIVTFIFEHGAFNAAATMTVTESMICYAAGVLPMGLQSYLIRGFYAMQDTKTPVKIKVFALVCNIVLNLASVHFLRHMGIALSTSVSYVIAYFLLAHAMRKRHGVRCVRRITPEAGISLLLSAVPGAAVWFLFNRLCFVPNLLLKLLAEGVLFLGLFTLGLWGFRRERFREVISTLKRH